MGKPLLDVLSKRLLSQATGLSRRACVRSSCLDSAAARRQLHYTSSPRPLTPTSRALSPSKASRSSGKIQFVRVASELPSNTRWFGRSSFRKSAAAAADASASGEASQAKRKFFPEQSEKIVAYWLVGSAISVFGIVVFGGLTRLTESGYVFGHQAWN
jgi:hypothetical protein